MGKCMNYKLKLRVNDMRNVKINNKKQIIIIIAR